MARPSPRGGKALLVLALILVSSTASLVPTVTAAEPPAFEWGDDIMLSDSQDASDDATVALMPDGGMVVAWRERRVAQYNVFFAVLDEAGGIVGQRHQLGENLSASMDPVVAVDSDGMVHFVWTAMEDQELWYARAEPDGDLVHGPDRLTDAQGDSAEASAWMDGRDHLHVVWFDGRDGVTHLYYMQLDRNGRKVVDDTQLVQTRTEQESAVTMDSRGDLHVVWNALAPVGQIQWNSEVHYTKVSSTGELLVGDRVIGTSRGNIGFPDVAVDLANDIHVVWPDGVGPRQSIQYAKLDSSGRIQTEREIVGGNSQGAGDVALAADGNNRLHVVWSQGLTGFTEVHYQALDDQGDPLGDPVQLTDGTGDSRFPAIGLSIKGEPRIAWSDWRTGNAEIFLKVATLPVEGVDLAVYARDITFDPPTVTGGEPFNVTITVHNQGEKRVGQATFVVQVDGVQVYGGTIHNLPPGVGTDNTLPLTLDEGDHVISVSITPIGEDDLAPHNNQAQRSVTAHPPGTLVADAGPDLLTMVGQVTYIDATGTVYRGAAVLSYEWDFGDGSPVGFGEYVEHVYGSAGWFTVTLRVSDGLVEDADTCLVHVEELDEPPKAVITPEGPLVSDRLTSVVLSASASTDDREIVNITWDMGDGTVIDGWQAAHLYRDLGIYPVTLTVEDSRGLIDVNRTTVDVRNLPPEVVEVQGPSDVDKDEKAEFSVTATDADGEVVRVGWDFDASDGIAFEEEGEAVTFRFEEAGTYNVTCIVRDDDGGQTVVHLEVVVKDAIVGDDLTWYLVVTVIVAVIIVAIAALMVRIRTKPNLNEPEADTGGKEV
ncbi:MAG: PKD domain-containing protein [Thermoplasmata archaeon]|nr:MAG: PKD domain-containing protein [Thermoplasmata archaeon]